MERKEYDFYHMPRKEREAFNKAYKPEEIRAFMEEGKPDDMVDVISTLARFDLNIEPGNEDLVLGEFSTSKFAPQILMTNTEDGVVMPRSSIGPLLRASWDIALKVFDLWTEDSKREFDEIYRSSTHS